ncbi:LysR family transcriptional regulator [Paenibacillus sp. SSG-1]|uniref:LysR family transcriptional regulator n=1 Tax=unclassified Paenibacillus TaxID=185978 RepID=UPI000B7D2F57|nr:MULTISPECIES: LysR substrate-binding domain-containing protein [unclassified Paenibacillus]OXL85163.1 LysR family transcriptional regulator [Paenibacillus sp. SSG-1]UYO07135.1 LysR family transcriptional regulator [Paenibacillus sp. PSB04]
MDFRLLEYFLAVCEELHFTKAAVQLGISQPTLSQQIRLLEERVGMPLFQRIGKRNYLTEAGQTLKEHALNIFHELEQAQSEINELKGMQRGRLTIGCSGNHLLTRTLISFHQKQPGISISVVELATEETRAGLLANKLDLGVVFLPLEDEQLVSKELYTEELCLAVAKQHPLAAAEAVKLDQLTEVPLILFPEKFLVRQMVDSYSAQAGVQLQPAFELSTMDSMLQMVRLGVGATILPRSYLLQGSDPSIRTVPIVEPVPQKKVGIVYRKQTFLSTAMLAFINELIRTFTPSGTESM